MAKLSRRPCAKCEVDTLHRGVICTVCGTIVRFSQYREIRNKGFRHQAARLHQRYGESYDSIAARTAILGRVGYIDAELQINAEAKQRIGPNRESAPRTTSAPFGRGRERTRI